MRLRISRASAGVAICVCVISALTGIPVRRDVAMTGEISLRGRVMPIGGLREKTMAAMRTGIKTVIIPKDNEKDLEEIDPRVRAALTFVTVDHVDSVLETALGKKLEPKAAEPENPRAEFLVPVLEPGKTVSSTNIKQ